MDLRLVLRKRGFVKRIKRYSGRKAQTSNGYSLHGLITKLKAVEPEFAKEFAQSRIRRNRLEAKAS